MSFFGQPLRWRALRSKVFGSLAGLTACMTAAVLMAVSVQAHEQAHEQADGHGISHWKGQESSTSLEASPGTVGVSSLPVEAATTYRLILAGGPFPYSKDGVVFGNREHLLPAKPRGFYHEYTVRTPAAQDRGARRIVCGGKPPDWPEVCFYTADHYASFQRIAR